MKKLFLLAYFLALPLLFAEDKPAAPPAINAEQAKAILLAQREYEHDGQQIDFYTKKQDKDRSLMYQEVGKLYDGLKVDRTKFDFNIDTLSFVPHVPSAAELAAAAKEKEKEVGKK